MTTVLFIIVALAASAPIVAAVLVSIGSRREDTEWSLGDPVVGPVQMIARRIVGFHTDCHHRGQPLERIDAWWEGSAQTKDQPVPSPDRRKRPAELSSRLMVTSG
jgi:hypothetical protein